MVKVFNINFASWDYNAINTTIIPTNIIRTLIIRESGFSCKVISTSFKNPTKKIHIWSEKIKTISQRNLKLTLDTIFDKNSFKGDKQNLEPIK